MSNTDKKLKESMHFFNRILETHSKPDEFESNLQAFLSSARSVTLVIQKEYYKKSNFKEWYEDQQREMQADEMLRFFNRTRTVSIHEKLPSTGAITYIKEVYVQSAPYQGWRFSITGKGEPVWITPGGYEFDASEFGNNVKRIYLFDKPPRTFLGVDLRDFSVVFLCRLYLAFLTALVKEASEKFGETSN